MPVELAAYTTDDLAAWLRDELGSETVAILGWAFPAGYDRVIAATVRAAGLTSLDAATDEITLLTHARAALWGAVRKAFFSAINLGYADGDRYDREALYKHAVAEHELALKAVQALPTVTAAPVLRVLRVKRRDPFADRYADPCRRWWP